MVDVDLVAALAVPFGVAVAAYLLNSRQQREFEKHKTRYHEKLVAFNRMNDALSRLTSNLAQLKVYTADGWQTETDEQLDQAVLRMISLIMLAREDERAVEGASLQRRLEEYNKLVESEKPTREEKSEALRGWLVGSFLTLILLRLRLAVYYGEEFTRAFYAADILIDNDEVENAAQAVNAFVMADLLSWLQRVERGPLMPDEAKEIVAGIARLEAVHDKLRDAMWRDLEATL